MTVTEPCKHTLVKILARLDDNEDSIFKQLREECLQCGQIRDTSADFPDDMDPVGLVVEKVYQGPYPKPNTAI
jgi:hypothetical protein